MKNKIKLTASQTEGLEILKSKTVLCWETGNSTWVNRRTLDSLVKLGLATVETSGSFTSGRPSGKQGWVSGSYHVVRIYTPV